MTIDPGEIRVVVGKSYASILRHLRYMDMDDPRLVFQVVDLESAWKAAGLCLRPDQIVWLPCWPEMKNPRQVYNYLMSMIRYTRRDDIDGAM